MSTPAAAGSASHSATEPEPPLLLLQYPISSGGSAAPEEGEEEVLVESIDQVPPVSSRKLRKGSPDTEEILNLLKTGNKWTQDPGAD